MSVEDLPTEKNIWASGDEATIQEPTPTKVEKGWEFNEAPPSSWFNWILNYFGKWIDVFIKRAAPKIYTGDLAISGDQVGGTWKLMEIGSGGTKWYKFTVVGELNIKGAYRVELLDFPEDLRATLNNAEGSYSFRTISGGGEKGIKIAILYEESGIDWLELNSPSNDDLIRYVNIERHL